VVGVATIVSIPQTIDLEPSEGDPSSALCTMLWRLVWFAERVRRQGERWMIAFQCPYETPHP
jgi:hypothetical protein